MNTDGQNLVKIILILLVLFIIPEISAQAQDKQAIEEKVTRINRQLFDALIEGDADKITALYTTDGTLFPPGGETIRGENAIRAYWMETISNTKTLRVETQRIDFELYGDAAYESGRYQLDYQLPDEAEIQTAEGIYLIIWAKVNNSWKIHADMWN